MILEDCARVYKVMESFAHLRFDEDIIALLVAAEDRRFYSHCGVDPLSVLRAVMQMASRSSFSGASTVEMQLVRTVTGRRDLSLSRKVREALAAVCVSRRRSKIDIANTYLNIAYFGEGIIGSHAASKALFRRDVHQCTLAQKAVVVAALKRPIPTIRTLAWYDRLFRRARYLLSSVQG